MTIDFRQILPTYFTSQQAGASQLWLRDLSVPAGSLVEVVAPSGSGKTSLVHFLYGMRSDYSGSVLYDGKSLKDADHEVLANYRKEQISVVFQDMRLFNGQTVEQNIEIKRQLSPFHEHSSISAMASRLGITEKLSAPCGNCSYGEQQRVAIIRALMQPFQLLLLDEPFSHLDNANAEKAMQLILEEAGKRKATIIFADLERTAFYPNTMLLNL